MIATEDMTTLTEKAGTEMRRMLSEALQTAIQYLDYSSTQKLLTFASK
jgi:hypothetical protein